MRFSVARLAFAAGSALVLAGCGSSPDPGGSSGADDYPSKSIKVVVPFGPGSTADLAARAWAQCAEPKLGQPITVQNVEGGGGAIGAAQVASATPDGYTLGLASTGPTVGVPAFQEDVSYTYSDFEPLGTVSVAPQLFYTGANSDITSFQQVLDKLEDEPESITLGNNGPSGITGTSTAILAEDGYKFRIVAFAGGAAEIQTAALAGDIDVAVAAVSGTVLQQVDAGDLRLLAVGEDGIPSHPDVPTFEDLGIDIPDSLSLLNNLFGPNGLPSEVADELSGSIKDCVENGELDDAVGGEQYVPDPYVDADETLDLWRDADSKMREVSGRE